MKKLKSTLSISLMTLALMSSPFSAFSDELLDGRVSVAQGAELPAGLFAKASGYLPGDMITVTNPSNGFTVELLNLGSVDASSGVSILISQEAANRLGMSSNESLNAKLNPRSGLFDEAVSGSATISSKTAETAQTKVQPKTQPKAQEEYEYEDYLDSDSDFASEKRFIEQPSPAEQSENPYVSVAEDTYVASEESPAAVEEPYEEPFETADETLVAKDEPFKTTEEPVAEESFTPEELDSFAEPETRSEIAFVPEESSAREENAFTEPASESIEDSATEKADDSAYETLYEPFSEDDPEENYPEAPLERFEDDLEPGDAIIDDTGAPLSEDDYLMKEDDVPQEEAVQEKIPLIQDDYFDGEPIADFSMEKDDMLPAEEISEPVPADENGEEAFEAEIAPVAEEILPEPEKFPDEDKNGENVSSNEAVKDFEPAPDADKDGESVLSNENVADFEPEPDSDLPGEEVLSNEYVSEKPPYVPPVKPDADLSGEAVVSSEDVSDEDRTPPVEAAPDEDNAAETVASNENTSDEDLTPPAESAPETDLEGEEVASNEDVADEELTTPVEAEPDTDNEAENVASNEDTSDEENTPPVEGAPEADLEGEAVESNEDVTDEALTVDADSEAEDVASNEPAAEGPDADLPGEEVASNEDTLEPEAESEPEADLEGENVENAEGLDAEPEAIILIPAEEVAPVADDNAEDVIAIEPKPVEKEEVPSVTPAAPESIADYVKSEKDLVKNRFYIQVATLSTEENIKAFIVKYSKYPVVLIPNNKGAYKVLVGPLTEDEYGAVLAKFKAYGFKDAFLKSVK